jgi:Flp pilus assembly protein TadG
MVRGCVLARDESAATAVEFGILALPFFTIVFAILETAMVFLAGQVLDSAVNDSSRLIRTGQATLASGYTAAAYRNAICAGLYGMFDCTDPNKLKIKVTEIVAGTFADAAPAPTPVNSTCQTTGNCNLVITEAYQPGVGSSVVLVEAYYKWPTLVNLPMFNLATMPDGTRLLSAVRVFRNEPF